jgi:cobalt-zinc-cadmium efflux system outer membrane protein
VTLLKQFLVVSAFCAASAAQSGDPLTLERAIQEAVSGNLDLAASRFNISIAEARQITARLRPNPVMTVSGDHLDLLGTGYNTINNGGPNEYAIRTDFVLERGGKRSARIQLAAAEKSLAELGFRDQMRRLIFDVQSAFVDVQLAQENLKLATDNLNSLEGIVRINTARVRSGDLAEVELNRSQVAAMQYQTAVRQAELNLRQAKNRLHLLLGRPATAPDFQIAGDMRRDGGTVTMEDVRTRAVAQRPDLLEVKQGQARNQADLRLQLAYGRIDYTAGTEYRRQQAPSGQGNSLGFFFSAPLPVFNRNQGEIVRAQREVEQASTRIRALEAHVDNEVSIAYEQYRTSQELLKNIESLMLATAQSVRRITEYSYRRGEASLVEFLDAQRAFNEVTQSYNEARANYARSLFLIDSVTAASVNQ